MNARDTRDGSEDELLLPWLATGRLDPDQKARIEASLAQDPGLRRQFDIVHEERIATNELNETLGAPSPRTLDALMTRIDATSPRLHPARVHFGRLATWLSQVTPRHLAIACVTGLAIIAVQASIIATTLVETRPQGRFSTASYEGAPTVSGQVLLIGVVPTGTVGEFTGLLEAMKATIIGGPRPGGIYEIKIAQDRLPKADLDAAIERLRHQTQIVQFVINPSP